MEQEGNLQPEEESRRSEHEEETKRSEHDEIHNEDFQFVLKALLEAYQPILEEELDRVKKPEELKKEAESKPPSCEDELALANRIFDKFFTEEVAVRLLPPEGRQLLGPIEGWRWCLLHIRCCIIFGWLVCRGPRTFRAFAYYLYRYWICVRQALGTPVGDTLTAEQRQDFQTLIQALAGAYKPYLIDQLTSVDSPLGVPDEVLSGKIDCLEGEDEAEAIFERFLTIDTAPALLGKEAFAVHSQEPFFWFCRCWCLCAIRFGCCLARARSFIDVLFCLLFYFRCLRDCFRPLECQITDPHGCVEEDAILPKGIFRGVEIRGTATGAFCDHYTLQWRQDSIGPWQNTGIHYVGTPQPSQGVCGVVNGTLGYLETFPFVPVGPVEIQLCVFSNQQGVAPQCCTIQFELQRNLVWIEGIEGIDAADPPGVFDPTAQLVDGAGVVRSFGNILRIFGSAWIGGCAGRDIKRYTLSYIQSFVTDPTLSGFVQFWQVDYITPFQIDTDLNKVFKRELTNEWKELKFCFVNPFPTPHIVCNVVGNYLQGVYWSTNNPQAGLPVIPPGPPFWNPTSLFSTNCFSGRYTLRLTVEDTSGGIKHDLQQVWFDNKDIHGKITQIAGVPPCGTINLSQFAVSGGDCTVPWPANLLGIAYDEYIEEGTTTIPSDNYALVGSTEQGGYQLWIKKDGAPDPGVSLPIPGPVSTPSPPWGPPFKGTSRVGDPGVRCATAVPPPTPPPPPLEMPGILAALDMRRLDAVCNPGEPGLTLKRGECCGYIIRLLVADNSICPGLSGGHHEITHTFPICICNDLKKGE